MTRENRRGHSIRIHAKDLLFLQEEALQLRRDRFRATRELANPSLADVVSEVVTELKEHRRRAERRSGLD